ncbi:hypothetical protein BKA62DRAFT_30713 [Auriculariales sp. MPI-PUGE-AT-0066]|nr:hypothetical protein BKA62DRAFT_30713 [Auriculariales sp. MPI-PUGE-AT-0066]
MSANDYYGQQQGGYGGPPPGQGYYPQQGPPQGGYYPPQAPQGAYQQPGQYPAGGSPYYQGQPPPQTIIVQQQPEKDSSNVGCWACLAAVRLLRNSSRSCIDFFSLVRSARVVAAPMPCSRAARLQGRGGWIGGRPRNGRLHARGLG